MKRRWITRGLSLLAVLALGMPAAGMAEEMGEVDLYDPSVYMEAAQEEPAPAEATEPAPAEATEPVPADAIEAAPAEATESVPVEATEPVPAEATAPVPAEATAPVPVEAIEAAPETDPGEESPYALGETRSAQPEAVEAPSEAQAGEGELAVAAPAAAEEVVEMAVEPAPVVVWPNLYMGLGEQFQLDGWSILGGVNPASYASDRPDIVSVDPWTGVATAAALGTAQLTVTAVTGATAQYLVSVQNAPGALSFGTDALNLGKGETLPLTAFAPEGTASASITYTSSKGKVAVVDAAGNVTGKKTGTAVITATAYNGATASCTVKVCKAPSKLTLSSKFAILSVGESRTLGVSLPKRRASRIYWESDNPAVVTVDAAGNLQGVGGGTANVTARSFNNKQAVCKVAVLDGAAPTMISLNAQTVLLGSKETFQLIPSVGAGESAVYAYSTSKKRVATVSETGLITGKKSGTAVVTVTTHNGLQASVTVTVGKAPSKVTLSATSLTLAAGQTAQLSVTLSRKAASTLTWESSDASVATVDAGGIVTGRGAGTAVIRVSTFNGKSALCQVVVTQPDPTPTPQPTPEPTPEPVSLPENEDPLPVPTEDPTPEPTPQPTPEPTPEPVPEPDSTPLTADQMLANLSASGVLGSKKEAILGVMDLLIKAGFEPTFAAGVGANVYSEGTYGKFESSKYVSNYQKRPKYFCYLDGGDYYTLKDGRYELTAVYMSQEELDVYTGEAEGRLRYGAANYYRDSFSGKYAWEVDLGQLEALMEDLARGNWQGKFGLGIVQWTGARTRRLVALYRSYAGNSNTLTKAQAVAAENEMILSDFRGDYKGVYSAWRMANSAATDDVEIARSAGSLICLKYEIPANKEAKAIVRGDKAAEIYRAMLGNGQL